MSEEYGNDFVVLTDEDGREIELEHLDTVEYNGQTYMAFIPAEMSLEDAYELMIMKVELEDDGEIYESIEDIWPDYPTKDDFFFNEEEY